LPTVPAVSAPIVSSPPRPKIVSSPPRAKSASAELVPLMVSPSGEAKIRMPPSNPVTVSLPSAAMGTVAAARKSTTTAAGALAYETPSSSTRVPSPAGRAS
jgi:hypothetical protein